jgi:small subunit ribosomal protein S21
MTVALGSAPFAQLQIRTWGESPVVTTGAAEQHLGSRRRRAGVGRRLAGEQEPSSSEDDRQNESAAERQSRSERVAGGFSYATNGACESLTLSKTDGETDQGDSFGVVRSCRLVPRDGKVARGVNMPVIKIKESESFEGAMKRFKKTCEKAGILTELRRREYYDKPSISKKKKEAAARKRALKKARRSMN